MIILHPKATKYLPHKDLTTFWFDGQDIPVSLELFVRGAVAWPEDGRQGFALLGGQDVKSRVVYAFEEFQFMTVDPLAGGDGTFKHPGLGQWFMDMWAKYHCYSYYWNQHPDIHRRYSQQVYDLKTVVPKPELIQVHIVDQLGDTLIYESGLTRKFQGDTRSELKTQVSAHLAAPEAKKPGLGVHALRCLLAGVEHIGWMQPYRVGAERIHLLGRIGETVKRY